ncbi:hypothetical protein O9992_27280 [Vibrio lentus]|nr:hypothetical protein [Vibrio lentus]
MKQGAQDVNKELYRLVSFLPDLERKHPASLEVASPDNATDSFVLGDYPAKYLV